MGYYRSNRYRMGMGSDQTGPAGISITRKPFLYGRVTFRSNGETNPEDD
jgi:hypothetical protein